MASSISSGGFTFDLDSVGGKWYWTVQADNIYGVNQLYKVTDIRSPFGRLYDVETPIPGDVVSAMAETLQQVKDQLAPLLFIVSPSNPNFVLTVTEGEAGSSVGTIVFQNSGAFGSFLTATATSSVPWLQANPTTVAGLNKNEQGQFTININPTLLLATGSPYNGTITLQDNRQVPTVIVFNFDVTVLPKPVIATDITAVGLTYNITLAASGGSQQVQVSNAGLLGSILNASVAKVQNTSPWLQFVPVSVGPLVSMASTPVTFSVVNAAVPMTPGTYTETVLVYSSMASNTSVALIVSLVVTP